MSSFYTTIQLFLYLAYRHHKVIKATSPYLSLLMFAGCYLFCVAAIQLITFGSFVLPPETFTAMVIAHFVFIINGISLILITLFIKLLRVYRIFTCWSKNLGKQWNNLSLILCNSLTIDRSQHWSCCSHHSEATYTLYILLQILQRQSSSDRDSHQN